MRRPSFVSATSLGRLSGEDKGEPESPEPWRRGRAGTSVGRAVHAVLQAIDLASGADVDDRARAQAAAEGIPEREGEIGRLARTAVESNVVKRAVASGRFWREVPVAAAVGGGSLHGFIDLLFEEGRRTCRGRLQDRLCKRRREPRRSFELSTAGRGLRTRDRPGHGQDGQGSGVPVPTAQARGEVGGPG